MTTTNKKTIYINSSNFVKEINEEGFQKQTTFFQIPDKIRYYSGNFWTTQGEKFLLGKEVKKDVMFEVINHYKHEDVIILKANKVKFSDRIINENGILVERYNLNTWSAFNDSLLNENEGFEDHYFSLPELTNKKEIKNEMSQGINFINKEFIYNFHSKNYEYLLEDRTIQVTSLPSIYATINDNQIDNRTYEENLVLTFGGLIPNTYADSLILSTENNEAVQRYYDIFSEKYIQEGAATVINELAQFNLNIDISKKALDRLSKKTFIPFPWYCKIKFTNFGNNLDNFSHLIEKYPKLNIDFFDFIKNSINSSFDTNFIFKKQFDEQKVVKTYDLKEWIDSIYNKILTENIENVEAEENIEVPRNTLGATEVEDYSLVTLTHLLKNIKNNIKPKVRKYKNFTNNECEKHIILYKVEKRLFSNERSEPVQTFFIKPNTEEYINFIDTQIKYSTEYYYKIFAYVLNIGNRYYYQRYEYSDEKERNEDLIDGMMKYKVVNESNYKIFEIEVAQLSGLVSEKPLTPPVVSFMKEDNHIRFKLENSSLETFEKFINIENDDFQKFDLIRKSQENDDKDKIYCAMNDAEELNLQIYRTNNYPVNYLTFQGRLYKTLTLKNEKTFSDSLVPNIKYYYLFRYVNKHNVPSNVSKVFELELKNEEGYHYLSIKEINVNSTQERMGYKNLRRYLLVRPSITQTQINMPDVIRGASDISLGPSGENVWNKMFLLRITSKKTNRVLEFNFRPIINWKK